MDKLVKGLSKLALDWGSLVTLITGGLTVFFFIFNILATNDAQSEQIKGLQGDVSVLKEAIPKIERSLGRIEGKLGIYNRN